MAGRLQDRVAIITGAGSISEGIGNGRATAIRFSTEGASVVLVDRNEAALDATAEAVQAQGGDCLRVVADVSVSQDCERIVRSCIDAHGRVDILHNNVGIEIPGGLLDQKESDWDKTLNVNLKSMYLMCRSAIPHMVEQGSGSVVNISSINALTTLPSPSLAYSVSKAGVVAFTREVAIEFAPSGVRVNSILPGMMATPFVISSLTGAYGGDTEQMMRYRDALSPMGRQGESWDVAAMAVFLASDDSRYVTGATMVVDGGQSLRIASRTERQG